MNHSTSILHNVDYIDDRRWLIWNSLNHESAVRWINSPVIWHGMPARKEHASIIHTHTSLIVVYIQCAASTVLPLLWYYTRSLLWALIELSCSHLMVMIGIIRRVWVIYAWNRDLQSSLILKPKLINRSPVIFKLLCVHGWRLIHALRAWNVNVWKIIRFRNFPNFGHSRIMMHSNATARNDLFQNNE